VPPSAAASAPAAPPKPQRRKKGLPTWAHPLAFAAVRLGAGLVNIAGPEPAMRFLRRTGGLYSALPLNRRRLQRAIDNIAWCFPTWPAPLVRDYALESYRHLFCLGAEVMLTQRLLSADGYARYVEIGDLGDGLTQMCSGKPVLLITGHCGNWELLGTTLSALGFPMHALYRPLDMAPLDAWMHETRSRRGLTLVDKFGAAEVLPKLLEDGQAVGFIADQNAGDRGLFVPFFNRMASAYKTIGLLAMKYGATVVCGHARRLSGLSARGLLPGAVAGAYAPHAFLHPGRSTEREAREAQMFRYRIEIVDSFGPEDWAGKPDPLFYITARYRRAIEIMVRRAPEQYLWMHRYWKSRPPHERKGSPFPGQLKEKIASLPWIDEDDVQQIVERSERDSRALRAG
jgi:KDO2-lipid IV(A) lauroyltransferase